MYFSRQKKLLFALLWLFSLFTGFSINLLSNSESVSAGRPSDGIYEWVDRKQIVFKKADGRNTFEFEDSKLDNDYTYKTVDSDGCPLEIKDIRLPNLKEPYLAAINDLSEVSSAELTYSNYSIDSACDNKTTVSINLTKPSNFNIVAWFDSKDVIKTIRGRTYVYSGDGSDDQKKYGKNGSRIFRYKTEKDRKEKCVDILLVKPNNIDGEYIEQDKDPGSNTSIKSGYDDCYIYEQNLNLHKSNIKIGGWADVLAGTPNNRAGAASGEVNPEVTEGSADCESQGKLYLSFIVCPLINLASDTVSKLEGQIQKLLINDQLILEFGNSEAIDRINTSWNSIRVIANTLLIVVFLLIIFGQTLSIEAYTVKKALPRIVAAAVLIQLSFLICGILLDFTNIIGLNLDKALNLASGNDYTPSIWFSASATAVTAAGTVIGLAGLISAAGGGGAVILAISALLAIFAAFLTLAFREVAIISLIIFSPIAILAWVLPNTEKYFKWWWNNFLKILMMYPLIVLIFAISAFVSEIAISRGGGDAVVGIILIFAPLFAVPMTFKWGGQLMALGAGVIGRMRGVGEKAVGKDSQLAKDFKTSQRENRAIQAREAPTRLGRAYGRLGLGLGNALPGRPGQRRRGAAYGEAVQNRRRDAMAATENMTVAEIANLASNSEYYTSGGARGSIEQFQAYSERLADMGAGGRAELAALARDAQNRGFNNNDEWRRSLGAGALRQLMPNAPDAASLTPGGDRFGLAGRGARNLAGLDGETSQRLLDEANQAPDFRQFIADSGLNGDEVRIMIDNEQMRAESAITQANLETIAQNMGW